MGISSNTPFLRQALLLDAAASGATGLLLLAASTKLSGLLGLPASLLFWIGVSFVPFVAVLAFLATRDEIAHWAVWAVICGNALWVVESFHAAFALFEPTSLGTTFIAGQALAVAVFAALQVTALRRTTATARYA